MELDQIAENPHRPPVAKWIVGVLAVVLPAQLTLAMVISEPYPGFLFPSFGRTPGEVGDTVKVPEPRMTIVNLDGSTIGLDVATVLEEADLGPQTMMQRLFPRRPPRDRSGTGTMSALRRWVNRHNDGHGVADPALGRWLGARVVELEPAARPVMVRMEWVELDVDVDQDDGLVVAERTVRSYDVAVGAAGSEP